MTATIRTEYRETRRKLAAHRLAVQKALAITYARLRRVQAMIEKGKASC